MIERMFGTKNLIIKWVLVVLTLIVLFRVFIGFMIVTTDTDKIEKITVSNFYYTVPALLYKEIDRTILPEFNEMLLGHRDGRKKEAKKPYIRSTRMEEPRWVSMYYEHIEHGRYDVEEIIRSFLSDFKYPNIYYRYGKGGLSRDDISNLISEAKKFLDKYDMSSVFFYVPPKVYAHPYTYDSIHSNAIFTSNSEDMIESLGIQYAFERGGITCNAGLYLLLDHKESGMPVLISFKDADDIRTQIVSSIKRYSKEWRNDGSFKSKMQRAYSNRVDGRNFHNDTKANDIKRFPELESRIQKEEKPEFLKMFDDWRPFNQYLPAFIGFFDEVVVSYYGPFLGEYLKEEEEMLYELSEICKVFKSYGTTVLFYGPHNGYGHFDSFKKTLSRHNDIEEKKYGIGISLYKSGKLYHSIRYLSRENFYDILMLQ